MRTIHAHTSLLWALAVLPGGARFISGANDHTAKLWTLEGVLERTFAVGSNVLCVAVLPDGVHFVIGLGQGDNEVDVGCTTSTARSSTPSRGTLIRCTGWR